jgi:predicted alpha/beta hydrolase
MTAPFSVIAADGARSELIVHAPAGADRWIYWCPAMGVTARQYRVFAEAVAATGVGIAVHEWRGAGSSDRRASRRSDWGYRELLDDIDAGVAALRAAHGVRVLAVGGHSLGAQVGLLALARRPELADAALVVASGLPWWRTFPWWQRPLIFTVFGGFRLLAALFGRFPGRRVGFAGEEARGVIADWTRSGLTGRYRPDGVDTDLEAALAALSVPALALGLTGDRYVPAASLAALQSRLGRAQWTTRTFAPADFGSATATHFSWMKDPGPLAAMIAGWLRGLPQR